MAGNFLAKTIGIAALGIASYDTLGSTKRQTSRYLKQTKLDRIDDTFLRTSAVSTESETENKMHNWARNWRLGGSRILEAKDAIVGYTSSFLNQLGDNAVTFLLGATAVFTGAKKGFLSRIKLPFVGKLAAGFLALKGLTFVLHDLLGIGAPNTRRFDIRQ